MADGSWYVTVPPVLKAPPWIHTITGNGPSPVGACTSRYRQSSLSLLRRNGLALVCRHGAADAVLASVVVQAAGGCGGVQRRLASGGAAYGMPKYERMPSRSIAFTEPFAVAATSGAFGGAGGGVSSSPPHALSSAMVEAVNRNQAG